MDARSRLVYLTRNRVLVVCMPGGAGPRLRLSWIGAPYCAGHRPRGGAGYLHRSSPGFRRWRAGGPFWRRGRFVLPTRGIMSLAGLLSVITDDPQLRAALDLARDGAPAPARQPADGDLAGPATVEPGGGDLSGPAAEGPGGGDLVGPA